MACQCKTVTQHGLGSHWSTLCPLFDDGSALVDLTRLFMIKATGLRSVWVCVWGYLSVKDSLGNPGDDKSL